MPASGLHERASSELVQWCSSSVEAGAREHRLQVVVVDVRDDRDAQARLAQRVERLHAIVTQLELLGDDLALAVDQLAHPLRGRLGAERAREAPPGVLEQLAVQVVGPVLHGQVGVAHGVVVRGADPAGLERDAELARPRRGSPCRCRRPRWR